MIRLGPGKRVVCACACFARRLHESVLPFLVCCCGGHTRRVIYFYYYFNKVFCQFWGGGMQQQQAWGSVRSCPDAWPGLFCAWLALGSLG
jgi:hypothetical protein